ncbi:MAG: ribonuclease Z [Candidatus Diapherotrites archaeon]
MSEMKLVFLGTGASNPTKKRNLSSVALKFNGEWLLFDCAEGTQRQMLHTNVSYMKVNHIFITHFHGDHILGLPGLVATMAIHEREEDLHIYGPKGVRKLIGSLMKVAGDQMTFKIKYHEVPLNGGEILKDENFSVRSVPLKHNTKCFGYVFKEKDKEGKFMRNKAEELGIPVGPLYSKLATGENVTVNGQIFRPEDVMDYSKGKKGRKISYIVDTMPNEKYFKAIEDSDLLIHESSFADELEKRAKETSHSTSKQAAEVAKKCNVKRLILTHVSPRYKNDKDILADAKKVFKNTKVAEDFLIIEIK